MVTRKTITTEESINNHGQDRLYRLVSALAKSLKNGAEQHKRIQGCNGLGASLE